MAEEPVLSGATMAKAGGFSLSIPQSVVLVFDETLMPKRTRKSRKPHPFRRLSTLNDEVAMVCAAGPGAPSAAVVVEFLAAFDVKSVVAVGTAGDLVGSLPTSMHAVTAAVSDEGTSKHYSSDLSADTVLTARLAAATGLAPLTAITTDVPFRHTPERLEHHRGVADVVEMECAAVFATARAFNMNAGSLIVISDHFDGDEWQMRDRAEVTRELSVAVAAATAVIVQ